MDKDNNYFPYLSFLSLKLSYDVLLRIIGLQPTAFSPKGEKKSPQIIRALIFNDLILYSPQSPSAASHLRYLFRLSFRGQRKLR